MQLLGDAEDELELSVRAGHTGLEREVTVPRIQKPGLALTGYAEQLHQGRLLVLGGTEVGYLASVADAMVELAVATVMASNPACIVVTRGLEAPSVLARACEERAVPLLVSTLTSAQFIGKVTAYLAEQLAPRTTVHGVMLDVLGVGILLRGKSGIGKSEIALELITRGHRLVADDVVEIRRPG
ncbi:MAG: HPr kinase/phosphorylase, partial [Myxococcota bacterium]